MQLQASADLVHWSAFATNTLDEQFISIFSLDYEHHNAVLSWPVVALKNSLTDCQPVENIAPAENPSLAAGRAAFVRSQIPPGGLFAGLDWRISPEPFPIGENLAKEIESLGRVLLQFYRATNLLYRKSVEGKQPEWVARWLDLGKPR